MKDKKLTRFAHCAFVQKEVEKSVSFSRTDKRHLSCRSFVKLLNRVEQILRIESSEWFWFWYKPKWKQSFELNVQKLIDYFIDILLDDKLRYKRQPAAFQIIRNYSKKLHRFSLACVFEPNDYLFWTFEFKFILLYECCRFESRTLGIRVR